MASEYNLSMSASHSNQHDVETGRESPRIQQFETSISRFLKLAYVKTVYPWLYVSSALLNLVILIMTSVVVHGSSTSLDDQIYMNFYSSRFLLFTSAWTFIFLIYIFSLQAVFDAHAPDWNWTKRFAMLATPGGFINTFLAHFVTITFWFVGGVIQAVWLTQKWWCRGDVCKYLLPSSVAFDAFVDLFAFFQVILWIIPTLDAVNNSFCQRAKDCN